jgi:hypothetical protein
VKQKRVFREWQHPRDGRGRFSRSGGASWAKRAAEGFAKAEEGRLTKPPVAGRPRIGRSAKAGAILNQHVPGAGDALSKKWTPPEKLPERAFRKPADSFVGAHEGYQVLHEGVWRRVTGVGGGDRGDYVIARGDNGERIKIYDEPYPGGRGVIARFDQGPEIHEPLRGDQVAQMAAWRTDANRPPAMRQLTNREINAERYRKELAEAEKKLKELKRKVRARVRKKYPASDGYDKRDWDYYVSDDDDVRAAERDVQYPRSWLESTLRVNPDDPSNAHLDAPAYGLPVVAGELNRDRPLAVYGDLLVVEDEDQATFRHLRDLATLPAELHSIVARVMAAERANQEEKIVKYPEQNARRSAGIYVGSRPVHELNHSQDLEDEPAKLEPSTDGSYKDTRKWSEVAGVYRGYEAIMIAGVSGPKSKGEVALHEFGHALDDAVGRLLMHSGDYSLGIGGWASSDPEWRELWRQTVAAGPDMNPYFSQQGEDRGAKEMWAEAFAEWARARAKARKSDLYTEGGGDFLANRGGLALMREFRIPKENAAAAVALNAYFERLVAKLGVDL